MKDRCPILTLPEVAKLFGQLRHTKDDHNHCKVGTAEQMPSRKPVHGYTEWERLILTRHEPVLDTTKVRYWYSRKRRYDVHAKPGSEGLLATDILDNGTIKDSHLATADDLPLAASPSSTSGDDFSETSTCVSAPSDPSIEAPRPLTAGKAPNQIASNLSRLLIAL